MRNVLMLATLASQAGTAAAQVAQSATVPVLRTISHQSGTRGEERDGRYVILDPRSSFRRSDNAKIIVAFQWLGEPGKHQLSGTWRGPNGVSVNSAFEYVAATREFGAFWTLPLTPDTPPGSWTFEAQVDGQAAGSHPFEIVDEAGSPETPATTSAVVPLTRQELFAKVLQTTVTVEALDGTGRLLATGPGTPLNEHTVVTAFDTINGAARLRIRPAQGQALETDAITAFDRGRDWVMVHAQGLSAANPARADRQTVVGTSCVTVGAAAGGTLAVTAAELVGVNELPRLGKRFSISLLNGPATPGAPVLNDFGQLIGTVSSGPYPGTGRNVIRMQDLTAASQTLVIPIDVLMAPPDHTPVRLSELATRGVFTPRVTMDRHVMSGGFAARVLRDGGRTQPIDQKTEFRTDEKSVTTFVTWDPKDSLKETVGARIYDADNQIVGEAPPKKMRLRPGALVMSTWQFGLPRAAGIYRVDVILGADVAWRGFLHVVE